MTVEEALRQHIGQDGNRFGLVGLHWDGVWSHAGGALIRTSENPFGYAPVPGLLSDEVDWYFGNNAGVKDVARTERLRLWLAPKTHAENVVGALIGLGTQYWLAPLRAEGVQDKHVLMLADSNGAGIVVNLWKVAVK